MRISDWSSACALPISEIVSLDLGPRTSQEIIAVQTHEIEQERFTSIDRRLMRDADGEGVVRISQADPGQHASLIGRLRTLSRLGLAEEGRKGRWTQLGIAACRESVCRRG